MELNLKNYIKSLFTKRPTDTLQEQEQMKEQETKVDEDMRAMVIDREARAKFNMLEASLAKENIDYMNNNGGPNYATEADNDFFRKSEKGLHKIADEQEAFNYSFLTNDAELSDAEKLDKFQKNSIFGTAARLISQDKMAGNLVVCPSTGQDNIDMTVIADKLLGCLDLNKKKDALIQAKVDDFTGGYAEKIVFEKQLRDKYRNLESNLVDLYSANSTNMERNDFSASKASSFIYEMAEQNFKEYEKKHAVTKITQTQVAQLEDK